MTDHPTAEEAEAAMIEGFRGPNAEVEKLTRWAHAAAELAEGMDYIADQEGDDPAEAARVHGIATACREAEQVALKAAGSITPEDNA